MKRTVLLLLITLAGCGSADRAMLEQVNIFEAQIGGYAHYRVPAIAVTNKGTVLALTEARKNTSGDWGTQDIMLRRSMDGGKTWDGPRIIGRVAGEIQQNPVAFEQGLAKEGEVTYNNIVPIIDPRSDRIHFLVCVEYARAYYFWSDDDAETLSEPVDITETFERFRPEYDWKVIASGPGHGIKLGRGRLVVPVWMSDGTGGHAHRPSIVSTIYSDDEGRSWERGEVVVRHPELKNPSETIAVELADGRVMLNIRHESPNHRRAVTISADGARGWSELRFQPELLEPICMASIVRYSTAQSGGRNRIIFANPHSDEPRDPAHPENNHKRQNVSVKLSYDEGESWPVSKTIEPGISGYSDLAVGPDGMIYLIYERGSPSGKDTNIQHVTVARFNLEWLTEGEDSP